jgi:HEXXH motif-containing protein
MIAELLVHECSHQHFYLLRRLGSMHDEADATLYYSPVRDMGRPLLYILLAYHAVANMLLFHRAALAAGAPDAGLHAGRTADLSAWLPALQAPLMRPGALTALGRMLFEPLQARLAIQ